MELATIFRNGPDHRSETSSGADPLRGLKRCQRRSFPAVGAPGISKEEACRTMSRRFQRKEAMRSDHVQVSWDATKSKWQIRIENGEEVIRRHCDAPKNAEDQTLRTVAQKTVEGEGYELDLASLSIHR